MEKKRGMTPVYENSFKILVAREYLTTNLGYGRIAEKFGLSASTVEFFVRWYRKNTVEPAKAQEGTPIDNSISSASPLELEEKLKEANLKITALEMLLANASKEAGFDIVKKLGTKQ